MSPLRTLDAFVERGMAQAKTPGVALGLIRPGHPRLARGYGYRDRKAKLPTTPRTMFGIASITKSFTALAILRLEEERRLRVTDPVTRHLPELKVRGADPLHPIRIHHFLTHSSGLPPLPSIYYTSMRSVRRDPPFDPRVARRVGIDPDHVPIDTYEQLMRYLSEARYAVLGPPGRYFSYSNEAFGLLGAIIERVSGRAYESFLEEAILAPAGMRSTTFDTGILLRQPEVTTLYSPRWTGRRHSLVPSDEWWEDACLRGSGSLRTNALDLLRYLEIFLTGGRVGGERVVARTSVERMVRPHIAVGRGSYYGYGLEVRPDFHGTLLVAHSGGLKGVSSYIAAAPRRGVGAVVLANADAAPAARWAGAAVNLGLELPLTTPFRELPRPRREPPPLRPYAGWFCSGEGIWAQVRPRGDHLRLDFRGIETIDRNITLRPAANDEFVVHRKGQSDTVRFLRNDSGRIFAAFLGWRVVRRRTESGLARAAEGRMVW